MSCGIQIDPGADSLDNIWPQCGQVPNGKNYKDIKDRVESYLAIQVLLGKKDLDKAMSGIASDWTQFISETETFCGANSCDIATKITLKTNTAVQTESGDCWHSCW